MAAGDEVVRALVRAGVTEDDARALRRAAMTLRRWYEMECGSSDAYSSWCVVRGRREGGEFVYDDAGEPHVERHDHATTYVLYKRIADREAGARRRVDEVMARYPELRAHHQTDPRGPALYVLRPGDVPEGAEAGSHYDSGVAVY